MNNQDFNEYMDELYKAVGHPYFFLQPIKSSTYAIHIYDPSNSLVVNTVTATSFMGLVQAIKSFNT